MSPAVIHVVDDDEDMRTVLALLLRAEGYAVRTYSSAADFLLNPSAPGAGCVVLDLQMPGLSGLELQEKLELPVVFLTGRGDVSSSVRAMKAGAVDFLTKPVKPEHLLRAIAAALARGRSAVAQQEAGRRYDSLTPRERAVLDQIVAGKPNKIIARGLGITARTVKAHRGQVMAKMQASSVVELVRIAGWIKG